MNDIDFNERVNTYTNQVQDILCEYFGDSTAVNIRGAAMDIALLYAQRENELMRDILHRVETVFNIKTKDDEPDKEIYKGNDVLVRGPSDIRTIEGYSGAFCECGYTLHIKTPKKKQFYVIECPRCKHMINLFCGKEGEKASPDLVRSTILSHGVLGD